MPPLDGSGSWVPVGSTVNPAVTNTAISSTDWNALFTDLKTSLSTAMFKDGQATPTANIGMGGFKLTGLAAATAAGNALRYEQLFTSGAVTLLGPLTSGGAINMAATTAVNEAKTTVASAATPDIWTATGNVIDYTGTTTATGFAAAPQAGTSRTLVCAGAAVFTAGANMIIDGTASGANFTAVANQKILVIAFTTTQFMLVPLNTVYTPLKTSLAGDVALNNTGTYFNGPSVAQGAAGTWFFSGTVTLLDSTSPAAFRVRLTDGTTVISSAVTQINSSNSPTTVTLSGYLTNPAGNVTMQVKDISNTTGVIAFNTSGESKDSTLTAIRVG